MLIFCHFLQSINTATMQEYCSYSGLILFIHSYMEILPKKKRHELSMAWERACLSLYKYSSIYLLRNSCWKVVNQERWNKVERMKRCFLVTRKLYWDLSSDAYFTEVHNEI